MDIKTLFMIMEHLGVIAFAISGALVAIEKETDAFGVLVLAFITSFGGGVIRDLILDLPTPGFFTEAYVPAIITCLITVVLVIVFAICFRTVFLEKSKLISTINNYIDAVGLGAFTVSGVQIAISVGKDTPFIAIMMGMIACIGGGMIRDVMLGTIPFVLRKRIYAIAALAGAGAYYLLWYFNVDEAAAMIVGALVTILIRVLATVFKLNIPKVINYSKINEKKLHAQPPLNLKHIEKEHKHGGE